MKWNTIIIVVLGLIVVGAAALLIMNLASPGQSGPGNATVKVSPTPVPPPTKTSLLQQFAALREKINASGQSYGGAAVQVIENDETAMVYMYKPAGQEDISGLLTAGFSALYSVFDTKDPLLVGIVDTTQKISAQQFKVDIYALERSLVEAYQSGKMTGSELAKNALYVTPETTRLRSNNTTVKKAVDLGYNRSGNYTAPSNRTMAFVSSVEQSGYSQPMNLQAGRTSDGSNAVSVVMPVKTDATESELYGEIESIFKACAAGYGDYDKYMISLLPSQESITSYYYVDAPALPVLAYLDGDISQYQLYNAVNLTYYTK